MQITLFYKYKGAIKVLAGLCICASATLSSKLVDYILFFEWENSLKAFSEQFKYAAAFSKLQRKSCFSH